MTSITRLGISLRRLGELELDRGPLAGALTEWEKQREIQRLRGLIPAVILDRHDSLLERGRPSVAVVCHGACPVCQERPPRGRRPLVEDGLDVCGNCGVFLVGAPSKETPVSRLS